MRTPLAFVPAFAKALLVADLCARHGILVSARAKVHGLARPMHREGACNAACGRESEGRHVGSHGVGR